MKQILVILCTRPEAIKLCPVILDLRVSRAFDVKICATAQHRALLDQVLEVFQVTPDYDLDLMRPQQSLLESTARILTGLGPVLDNDRPDLILVQGDTTTTLGGALAAFYHRIPVGHVEAGLRTGDLWQPYPEEMNRVVVSRLSTLHFDATSWAAENLKAEGIHAGSIHVTGNSGIDAVLQVKQALEEGAVHSQGLPAIDSGKRLLVVTTHRRETFGESLLQICRALETLAGRGDVQVVLPVHPNPQVHEPVYRRLGSLNGISLVDPLPYVSFVDLLRRAYLVITDSGGIQEEAPSLGKPVLVLRDKTERPEAVHAGTVKLVGPDYNRIVTEANLLLDCPAEYERMARIHNPYGDGKASGRIRVAIQQFFESTGAFAKH